MQVQRNHLPDARPLVDHFLAEATRRRSSDIHVEPVADGYEIKFRIDGLLETHKTFDKEAGEAVVNRLMIMAHLLTYRQDVPQEGRVTTSIPIADGTCGAASHVRLELRLSVVPTRHGMRAVVRLPAELVQPRRLADLSLPPPVLAALELFARQDSGLLAVTGPAGSGKTTTVYALLEYMVEHCRGISIVSLEDPVERDIAGVTQIEVTPFGSLSYQKALRSMLRQDPQVLALGEIRDAETASLAMQAALTGHRLVCTMHAGSPAMAIRRWCEMGLERHQISSAVYGVLTQRLLRRRRENDYRGRVPVAQFTALSEPLRQAVLADADATALETAMTRPTGIESLRACAAKLVEQGITDQREVLRVLGEG